MDGDDEGNAGLINHADQGYGSGATDLPALASRDSDDDLIL